MLTIEWQTCTGRQVASSPSHLQAITCLGVDRNSNFLLTGSKDSNVLVWSLPALLSFSSSSDERIPIHHLDYHRSEITALVVGHSTSTADIAVSASKEETVHIWDYHAGTLLRTVLVPSAPLSLALDPADRALYAGYADGSVQLIEFFARNQILAASSRIQDAHINPLHDDVNSAAAIQPPESSIFSATSQNLGPALALALSWDATTLLSGHESGMIAAWDIARGAYQSTLCTLPGPVSNLQFLQPSGFPSAPPPTLKINNIVKPKISIGGIDDNTTIPDKYTFTAQPISQLRKPHFSATEPPVHAGTSFEASLAYPGFPAALLEEGIAELAAWRQPVPAAQGLDGASSAPPNGAEPEFISLDVPDQVSREAALEEQNAQLQQQVAALQRVQKVTFKQLAELRKKQKSQTTGWAAAGTGGEEDEEMQDASVEVDGEQRGWLSPDD